MKTIVLCSYRSSDHNEDALGLERDANGVSLLDRRIFQLRALGLSPVCVLAGNRADDQLRGARLLASADLVFDTNDPCSLISNTRAGAFTCDGEAAFVLPLEVPPPPLEIWNFLRNEYGKVGFATPYAFLQAVSQGAPCHFGFPLLLTRQGGRALRETSDLKSLLDSRLLTLQLEYQPEAALEPLSRAL